MIYVYYSIKKIIAEVIHKLEKEAGNIKDVTALLQTMHLEKFKFITNRFIDKKQKLCTKLIYNKITKEIGRASCRERVYVLV